ncbi:hypothetical protein [Variovorax sp. PDC80]|uniref:hypothetical protein n=1 Tax=Variovorax sp. PDC80 TaxID=1882827 RepID=UPI0015A6BF7C|nr:hypothetical protein [Variovorax sp. PDC80]
MTKNLNPKVLARPMQGARFSCECLVGESLAFFDPADCHLDPEAAIVVENSGDHISL